MTRGVWYFLLIVIILGNYRFTCEPNDGRDVRCMGTSLQSKYKTTGLDLNKTNVILQNLICLVFDRGAVVAQWCEGLPLTNVAQVWFWPSQFDVGWGGGGVYLPLLIIVISIGKRTVPTNGHMTVAGAM